MTEQHQLERIRVATSDGNHLESAQIEIEKAMKAKEGKLLGKKDGVSSTDSANDYLPTVEFKKGEGKDPNGNDNNPKDGIKGSATELKKPDKTGEPGGEKPHKMTDEEIQQIRLKKYEAAHFKDLDVNHNGMLDKPEIRAAMDGLALEDKKNGLPAYDGGGHKKPFKQEK